MKLKIHHHELLGALKKVSLVVNKKSTIPALEYAKLYYKENKVFVLASNIEDTIIASFPYDVEFEPFLLDVHKTISILNTFKNDLEVILNIEGTAVEIMQGKAKFLSTAPPIDEYPDVFEKEKYEKIGMFNPNITKVLALTKNYIGKDDLRLIMTGAFLLFEKDKLFIVGTDAHRLIETEIEFETAKETSFVLAASGLNVITKIFKDEYDIHLGNKKIMFTVEGITYISTMVEGKYPNYKSVIPTEREFSITVLKDELLNAITQCMISGNPDDTIVINANKESLELSSENLDFGFSNVTEIEAETILPETPFKMGLNYNFLNQIIKDSFLDSTTLHVSAPNRAIVIEDKTASFKSTYLIMPVMLTK